MTLMLTASEVGPLLDLPKAIALTEDVFAEYGRGQVDIHSPFHLFVREGALRVVSGALRESGWMGVRCGPSARSGGSPCRGALCECDGRLLSVMGYPFGTMRTAATVAVSLKHMARPDAHKVGMIGTECQRGRPAQGRQGGSRFARDGRL